MLLQLVLRCSVQCLNTKWKKESRYAAICKLSQSLILLTARAWVCCSGRLFVCLSVCLSVCPQHNLKTNDPKVSTVNILCHRLMSPFGHLVWCIGPEGPATTALHLMVNNHEGRKPLAGWIRPPGRPRRTWLNLVQQCFSTVNSVLRLLGVMERQTVRHDSTMMMTMMSVICCCDRIELI